MSANTKFETLWDVTRKNGNIAVACDRCNRRAVICGKWLERKYRVHHWDVRMHMLRDHIRCRRCGARPSLMRVTHQKPTLDLPPRDDAEWKRLARRLRG